MSKVWCHKLSTTIWASCERLSFTWESNHSWDWHVLQFAPWNFGIWMSIWVLFRGRVNLARWRTRWSKWLTFPARGNHMYLQAAILDVDNRYTRSDKDHNGIHSGKSGKKQWQRQFHPLKLVIFYDTLLVVWNFCDLNQGMLISNTVCPRKRRSSFQPCPVGTSWNQTWGLTERSSWNVPPKHLSEAMERLREDSASSTEAGWDAQETWSKYGQIPDQSLNIITTVFDG